MNKIVVTRSLLWHLERSDYEQTDKEFKTYAQQA